MRLEGLRKYLKENNKEAILVTSYPNIFYLSSFTSEDCMLYITLDKAYLITDSRYTIQAKRQAKGFEVIIRKGSYFTELADIIKEKNVYFEDSMSYKDFQNLASRDLALFEPINIDYLRNVKDNEEIKRIQKACDIVCKTYDHIIEFVKVGMSEREVANEMVYFMKSLGASAESFETIVASGKNGAMPHAVVSDKKIEEGDFVTLDFGCIYKGYCSDMTRSFMVGQASDEMIEVYNVVKKAQVNAIKSVKPGIKAKEVDKVARDYIKKHGYVRYFTHSTGHGLGIVCHDPISVGMLSETVLEEGMVITVEPGIYIPKLGGIRIEDDILVTKDGYKVLTKKATKELISL